MLDTNTTIWGKTFTREILTDTEHSNNRQINSDGWPCIYHHASVTFESYGKFDGLNFLLSSRKLSEKPKFPLSKFCTVRSTPSAL